MCRLVVIFGLCCLTVYGQLSDSVRLAVSKELLNEYVFDGKELTVLYTLYNFHPSRVARDVELFDAYPDAQFIQVHGSPSVRWPHIPAASNVTHAVVVIPREPGVHNFTSATITYHTGDASKTTLHYSSAPGPVMIYATKEYNRRFATHTMDWIGFALLVAPCLLIPYMLWRSSASKYLVS
ncbi:hypothetical protein AHF37_00162 [Paragonimus kellicotti]|nr:hypothetical protein AHF37_00162 [Paragonimus kellicotti]